MILMTEPLRNKQIGSSVVKRLFLDSELEMKERCMEKNELMRMIISEMSEEQLFVLI